MLNSRQLVNQLRVAYFRPTHYYNPLLRSTPDLPHDAKSEFSNTCRHTGIYSSEFVYTNNLPFVPCARVGGIRYKTYTYQQNFGAGRAGQICNGQIKYIGDTICLQSMPMLTYGKNFVCNDWLVSVSSAYYTPINAFVGKYAKWSLFI